MEMTIWASGSRVVTRLWAVFPFFQVREVLKILLQLLCSKLFSLVLALQFSSSSSPVPTLSLSGSASRTERGLELDNFCFVLLLINVLMMSLIWCIITSHIWTSMLSGIPIAGQDNVAHSKNHITLDSLCYVTIVSQTLLSVTLQVLKDIENTFTKGCLQDPLRPQDTNPHPPQRVIYM